MVLVSVNLQFEHGLSNLSNCIAAIGITISRSIVAVVLMLTGRVRVKAIVPNSNKVILYDAKILISAFNIQRSTLVTHPCSSTASRSILIDDLTLSPIPILLSSKSTTVGTYCIFYIFPNEVSSSVFSISPVTKVRYPNSRWGEQPSQSLKLKAFDRVILYTWVPVQKRRDCVHMLILEG